MVSRVDWRDAHPNMVALGLAIQAFARMEDLDIVGGAILITLGDPQVSIQYFGPNRVNGEDLIGYLNSIIHDLNNQPVSGDRSHP